MEIPDRKSCEGSMKLFKKSSLPELSLSTFLLFGKIFLGITTISFRQELHE